MLSPDGLVTENGQTRPLFARKGWVVEVKGSGNCPSEQEAEELRSSIAKALDGLVDELSIEVKPVSVVDVS